MATADDAGKLSGVVRIQLVPMGRTLEVERDTSLHDVLFAQGVEFPCGGRARCKGCRVRVLEGEVPITPEMLQLLSAEELAAGWRLSCQAQAHVDLKLELAQWEAAILADNRAFDFTPRAGLGVAVDLGTTTLVAQLLDLQTAEVLAVRTALNPQARHGADIMSRIDFALTDAGQGKLQRLIREQVERLVSELLEAAGKNPLDLVDVVIVGNTVMHHLFCGCEVAPLAHTPFETKHDQLKRFTADELEWQLHCTTTIRFLPGFGSFVGSDILAGLLATRLHESETLVALVDLGTNGEIVLGNRQRLLCASTAAGPAFEGARISMGMRAATGAIAAVDRADGQLRCHVLGNVTARGICGSGLVDAVAVALDLGWIEPSGRLKAGDALLLCEPVRLTQADIRELQLAKAAIAAGIRVLVQQWGARLEDLSRVYLAGAFGNYVSRASAKRIGLLPFGRERVQPSGNTALLGAKLALFSLRTEDGSYVDLRQQVAHVSLHDDPQFQDIYAEEMRFPG